MRILAFDADPVAVDFLCRSLLEDGSTVDVASFAMRGSERALVSDLAAIFVTGAGAPADVVTRELRVQGVKTPIFAIVPHDATDQAVRALDAGADDVISLPMSGLLLAARVRAVLRRTLEQPLERLVVGDLVVNRVTHRVTRNGHALSLTARQYALLEFLALRPGETVARPALLDRVWGLQFDPGSNVVDVHVAQLRKRMRDAGTTVEVRTIRGEGYALDAG